MTNADQRRRRKTLKFNAKKFVKSNQICQSADFNEKYQWDQEKDLIQQLGSFEDSPCNNYGTTGIPSGIYSCIHKANGEQRAVKIVQKARYDEDFNQQLRNEFKLLKELDHPNILRAYESFETDSHFYMVTEFCQGGELLDAIFLSGLTEQNAALMMKQLMTCINYCHQEHSIAHLDLKPENILLGNNGFHNLEGMKVIDFGNALMFKKKKKNSLDDDDDDNESQEEEPLTTTRNGLFGTPAYMSPEIVEEELYGPKADVWACGIIAFYMLTGNLPYYSENDWDLLEEIRCEPIDFSMLEQQQPQTKQDRNVPPEGLLSNQAISFVKSLLNPCPEDRPTAEEGLQHPWIQEAIRRSTEHFEQTNAFTATRTALHNMKQFRAQSKVQQATLALISAQHILKEDKDELGAIFRAMDMDSDGKLSPQDVQMGFQKYYFDETPTIGEGGEGEEKISEEEVEEIFLQCDLDGSGYIDYSEFAVAAMNEADVRSSENLEEAFQFFDADGDGVVSFSDLKEVFQEVFSDDNNDNNNNNNDDDDDDNVGEGNKINIYDDQFFEDYIALKLLPEDSSISLEEFSVTVLQHKQEEEEAVTKKTNRQGGGFQDPLCLEIGDSFGNAPAGNNTFGSGPLGCINPFRNAPAGSNPLDVLNPLETFLLEVTTPKINPSKLTCPQSNPFGHDSFRNAPAGNNSFGSAPFRNLPIRCKPLGIMPLALTPLQTIPFASTHFKSTPSNSNPSKVTTPIKASLLKRLPLNDSIETSPLFLPNPPTTIPPNSLIPIETSPLFLPNPLTTPWKTPLTSPTMAIPSTTPTMTIPPMSTIPSMMMIPSTFPPTTISSSVVGPSLLMDCWLILWMHRYNPLTAWNLPLPPTIAVLVPLPPPEPPPSVLFKG